MCIIIATMANSIDIPEPQFIDKKNTYLIYTGKVLMNDFIVDDSDYMISHGFDLSHIKCDFMNYKATYKIQYHYNMRATFTLTIDKFDFKKEEFRKYLSKNEIDIVVKYFNAKQDHSWLTWIVENIQF